MSQKRAIFEEVGQAKTATPAPRETGGIDKASRGARKGVRLWLMLLFALVVVMIAVGGLTRLTDSGLSITEWNVIKGAMPPLSAEAWAVEFDKYRAIPEYQLQNKGMSLSEFQFIYWWEWGHRQLGRVIGLVWALGFFGFLVARRIPTGWTGRLLLLGALGGLQGAIGWWMVSSGLTGTMLDVASYRLATHLGLAFVILGLIAWFVLQLSRPERDLMQARRSREPRLQAYATGLAVFAFVQILLGALVAGIDAGRSFIDWPLMNGAFFPDGALDLEPLWRNFFENPGLVQFMHRIAAYLLMFVGVVVWVRSRRSSYDSTKRAFTVVLGVLFVQAVIGVFTVWNAAPWTLAILHQFTAIILWVLILRGRHLAQFPIAQSIRRG
jgi:cytochrome c oxidase assembly protein subunit 15